MPTKPLSKIHFDGMHYRRDIGQKGLETLVDFKGVCNAGT